jgi:diguanylate cyclase (GGDEF)-like protein/PAS domain S-box-containing protein
LGAAAYPALNNGDVYRTQIEHVCKDGRVIWVDISGSILNVNTGESLWAFLDITERYQAATALRTVNQQLSLLLDSMAEGVYGVDINENCTFVNHSFLQILGYRSQDEVIGKHIHELIHHSHVDGATYPAIECRIKTSLLRNENLHCTDEVFWHSLGVPVFVEYWSRPIVYDGALQGGIVTFIDISERKEAEEKLRYSEQRFHDVSDAAGEYLWELDANMVYTYVSARSIDVKGYTPEELLGKSPMEFMPEEDIQAVGNIVNRAIANRAPFKLQHRDITKSGVVVWEEVNGVPIYDKNGDVIGLRGTGLNISERKEMEDQVRQLAFYDTLTSLPNRRLLNDRLSQAMSAGQRSGLYGALMFLDLDNFKPINDAYGHGVGDLLLIEAASRLKKCVRGMDTVARFGGDEFVVMLSELDTDKSDATEQARLVVTSRIDSGSLTRPI